MATTCKCSTVHTSTKQLLRNGKKRTVKVVFIIDTFYLFSTENVSEMNQALYCCRKSSQQKPKHETIYDRKLHHSIAMTNLFCWPIIFAIPHPRIIQRQRSKRCMEHYKQKWQKLWTSLVTSGYSLMPNFKWINSAGSFFLSLLGFLFQLYSHQGHFKQLFTVLR